MVKAPRAFSFRSATPRFEKRAGVAEWAIASTKFDHGGKRDHATLVMLLTKESPMKSTRILTGILGLSLLGLPLACGSESGREGSDGAGSTGNGSTGNGTGGIDVGSGSGGVSNIVVENPSTCDEAANAKSYVGCEFWPTVVANPVYLEFQPAVVVANGGQEPADVVVTGPNGFSKTETVPPGELRTIMLDWVSGLKGPEWPLHTTSTARLDYSARVDKGAYHLTSTVPVTAWQFNPLKYVLPKAECGRIQLSAEATECRSASNDASLLLPSTAMTGNYRVPSYAQFNEGTDWGSVPGGVAITATEDDTEVKVQLGPKCGVVLYPTTDLGTCVSASQDSSVPAKNGGDVYTFTMNAGDVVQLVGEWNKDPQVKNADISGSVINANKPVQAISFNAIAQMPDVWTGNADHIEETILPAEVIGKKYVVVPPTAPHGKVAGHVVRIYGNVDNTHLTYPDGKPTPDAPDIINAGDVVQLPTIGSPGTTNCLTASDHCALDEPFVVEGDQPFAVASFMLGGVIQENMGYDSLGDPSFMMLVTPEQFRTSYTFLAPADFVQNYADILVPDGASVTLDGAPLAGTPEAIGSSGWSVVRAPLDGAAGGIHTVETSDERGVGLSVSGFGYATSYYYPGGLNLKHISEPPIIK